MTYENLTDAELDAAILATTSQLVDRTLELAETAAVVAAGVLVGRHLLHAHVLADTMAGVRHAVTVVVSSPRYRAAVAPARQILGGSAPFRAR